MTMFVVNNIGGFGPGTLDPLQVFIDLVVIADDTELGLLADAGGMQEVQYNQVENGPTQDRLNELVNTNFAPDYGSGPQAADILIIAGPGTLSVTDGTTIITVADNGLALPPGNSGLDGADFNPTNDCVVLYDTTVNICVARAGSGGTLDLGFTPGVLLYHELSHTRRQLLNTTLALSATCDPASPAESDAIADENVMRAAIANRFSVPVVLRDTNIHCGGPCETDPGSCCIIASVVSGSPQSPEVQALRNMRDRFVRRSDVGFAFFEQLFHDYYSFSPQFSTEIARSPAFATLILDGFVNPLLRFWKLMVVRGFTEAAPGVVGQCFVDMHSDPAGVVTTVRALEQTEAYWGGQLPVDGQMGPYLDLLRDRAWTSEHVRWAIIEPVRLYRDLLLAMVDGASPDELGAHATAFIGRWAPTFPLDDVWGSLATDQVADEMQRWSNHLLVTEAARRTFAERLYERYSHISSIAAQPAFHEVAQ